MIDFRKAFDLVDHRILLKKLDIFRFSALILPWFKSYLSNRTQQMAKKNQVPILVMLFVVFHRGLF